MKFLFKKPTDIPTDASADVPADAPAGVSLIIAIVYVSALMLVMAGLAEVQLRRIRNMANREISSRVFYLSESALELAGLWAQTHGIGANSADAQAGELQDFLAVLFESAAAMGIANCADSDNDASSGVEPCAGIEVVGRSPAGRTVSFDGAAHYSVPLPGSGGAGNGGEGVSLSRGGSCDAPQNENLADADHPCHWNRLFVGQTVEIPLYYEAADGSVVKPDFGAGSSEEFRLRVRTPCEDDLVSLDLSKGSAGCAADERIELYPPVTAPEGGENPAYRDPEKDPVLVQWSIVDAEAGGAVIAWDKKDDESGKRQIIVGLRASDNNTEISSGRINTAATPLNLNVLPPNTPDPLENFIVLKYKNSLDELEKQNGKNIVDRQRRSLGDAIASFSKPVLRLNLVAHPQRSINKHNETFSYPASLNDKSFDIPYLEYQLLTKNRMTADSRILIRGWALVGDFRREMKKYITRPTSVSGFAIETF